jgi:23S rRNA (guanosine2251-2'-O)-methyltransferase
MAKDQTLLLGVQALEEALEAGTPISKAFLQKGGQSRQQLAERLKAAGIPFSRVPVEKLNRLTRKVHQGVVAWIAPVELLKVEDLLPSIYESGDTPLIAVADGITDVRNFGAILRSAEGLGVHGMLIGTTNSAPVSSDVTKTSAGALLRLPLCRSADLPGALRYMRQSGIQVVGITADARQALHALPLHEPTALVLGAEGMGLQQAVSRELNHAAHIPMKGQIGSLNVSVAAGIAFYEADQQRP